MNKDLVLANLADKKNTLKATFTVESGYGYQFAEERKSSTLGVIPLDTSFSPILRVRYTVKATRVGRHTDFDNVIMEIWTDETIEPTQALVQSAKILMRYFDQLVNPVIPEVEEEKATDTQEQEVYKLTVEELDLPTRIANALRKGGYKTVKDLSLASRDDISKVKNLGGKSVGTVIEKLEEKGVTLKG
jgi:DNA-directed RNA polymerase subunit alpha